MKTHLLPRATRVLHSTVTLGVLFVVLFPLYWMFITATTAKDQLLSYPPILFQLNPDFSAFQRMISERPLGLWLFNSAVLTLSSMAFALVISIFAAYSLSRFRSPFSSGVALLLLVTRMVPGTLLMVPLYMIFRDWGLVDSRLALIISYTTFEIPFATWMLKGYFNSLPRDLEEAAEVDGCTPLGAFLRIGVPLAAPGIAASTIASAVLAWSDYEFARGFLTSPSKWPLTLGLSSLFGEHIVYWNDIMAGSLLSILPAVALFIIMERYIVSGLTAGAVKS